MNWTAVADHGVIYIQVSLLFL